MVSRANILNLGPFSNTFLWSEEGLCWGSPSTSPEQSVAFPVLGHIVGVVFLSWPLMSVPGVCLPAAMCWGLRATHESDWIWGECLYPSFLKTFILDLKLFILAVLHLKFYYFVYLIIYTNLLKTWIHIFFSVNRMGQLNDCRLNSVPFHKLAFSNLFRKERVGFGPVVPDPSLIAASDLVFLFFGWMGKDSGITGPQLPRPNSVQHLYL